MATEQQPRQQYTYEDYLGWPEGERVELIKGTVVDMSPAPSREHQAVVGGVHAQIWSFLGNHPCQTYVAPFDVRLGSRNQSSDEIDTVVQPDIVVICDPEKLDDKGCLGAPDWIIEVSSPTTASTDHIIKRDLYEQHGVREYWLIHPIDRIVTIYSQTKAGGEYGKPAIHETRGELAVGVLADLRINWDLVFRNRPRSP